MGRSDQSRRSVLDTHHRRLRSRPIDPRRARTTRRRGRVVRIGSFRARSPGKCRARPTSPRRPANADDARRSALSRTSDESTPHPRHDGQNPHRGSNSGPNRSARLNYAFHYGMWRFYRKHYASSRGAFVNAVVYGGIAAKLTVSLVRMRTSWTLQRSIVARLRARPSHIRLQRLRAVRRDGSFDHAAKR
jgi:hypothetical protein